MTSLQHSFQYFTTFFATTMHLVELLPFKPHHSAVFRKSLFSRPINFCLSGTLLLFMNIYIMLGEIRLGTLKQNSRGGDGNVGKTVKLITQAGKKRT